MVITDQKIYTSTWSTIRDLLVATPPKITNSSSSATKTAGVYASYNDKKFKMPGIVIEPPGLEESDYKFSSSVGRRNINITVECYYKNTLGTDQLAEQVIDTIGSANIDGMQLVGFTSDQAFVDPNQVKFQLKTITFTFLRE